METVHLYYKQLYLKRDYYTRDVTVTCHEVSLNVISNYWNHIILSSNEWRILLVIAILECRNSWMSGLLYTPKTNSGISDDKMVCQNGRHRSLQSEHSSLQYELQYYDTGNHCWSWASVFRCRCDLLQFVNPSRWWVMTAWTHCTSSVHIFGSMNWCIMDHERCKCGL